MGLFDKLKGKKETVDWSNAYTATPKFYGKPDGTLFGAIALTEGTETVLPKTPQNEYRVDSKVVSEWKLVLVSTTKDTIIGVLQTKVNRKNEKSSAKFTRPKKGITKQAGEESHRQPG